MQIGESLFTWDRNVGVTFPVVRDWLSSSEKSSFLA